MTYTGYHLIASIIVAVIFGVLIDIDHSGSSENKIKCALSFSQVLCSKAGIRGIFHNVFLWSLFVLAALAWTLHLIMDGVL